MFPHGAISYNITNLPKSSGVDLPASRYCGRNRGISRHGADVTQDLHEAIFLSDIVIVFTNRPGG